MNEANLGLEHDSHIGEEAINECLKSRRIGFKEISLITAGNVFSRAPQEETFIVPDDNIKIVYENQAKSLGRKDLKFETEKIEK